MSLFSLSLSLPTTLLIALSLIILIVSLSILLSPSSIPPFSPSSPSIPPAHTLARFTTLWISHIRYRGVENATLRAAHARLGPIVRLSPREVSVNCVQGGIREVYAGGYEKGSFRGENWYGFFENFGGNPNMFSTATNKPHSTRKRMISNIYSKSVVTSSPALLAQASNIIYTRFLPYLSATLSSPSGDDNGTPGVLNMSSLLSATTMDIVTAYIFGLSSSSNLINDSAQLAWFLDLYRSRHGFNFWPQEFPRLTAWAERWLGYRLVPRWVDMANGEIEKWTMGMCDKAQRALEKSQSPSSSKQDGDQQGSGVTPNAEDTPVVYQQLRSALLKADVKAGNSSNGSSRLNLDIASEVLDHLAAGFDTSGITLTYLVHELSRHQDIQDRLRRELGTLETPVSMASAPALPDPKIVDALPLLHAVTWETLRLHSAIPGPQPRFTPPQGCRLGPQTKYYVPGGVRVSASAGLLHMNEDVYERAGEWRPDRWLEMAKQGEEKRRDMESRWFWAFGSGGRMCVGSHLAIYQMKFIIAALYTNFSTTIVDDTGIEQSDAYTAPPKSDRLLIRVSALDG